MKAHWTSKDFIVTSTSSYDDDDEVDMKQGYCAKCFGDMQAFASDGFIVTHYNSHQNARQKGLKTKK